MYILRFTTDIEKDIQRGFSANGPQIAEPVTGDAYPHEGSAEELAEELKEQAQFSIGHQEFFPRKDVIEVISDNEILVGSAKIKPFVHESGSTYWVSVDERHDGLACYASENFEELAEIADEENVIPDAGDELADGIKANKLAQAEVVKQGDEHLIFKI